MVCRTKGLKAATRKTKVGLAAHLQIGPAACQYQDIYSVWRRAPSEPHGGDQPLSSLGLARDDDDGPGPICTEVIRVVFTH